MSFKMGTDEPLGRNLRGEMVTQAPTVDGPFGGEAGFSVNTRGNILIVNPVSP